MQTWQEKADAIMYLARFMDSDFVVVDVDRSLEKIDSNDCERNSSIH